MDWGTDEKNEWHQPAEGGSGSGEVMVPLTNESTGNSEDKAGSSHTDSGKK